MTPASYRVAYRAMREALQRISNVLDARAESESLAIDEIREVRNPVDQALQLADEVESDQVAVPQRMIEKAVTARELAVRLENSFERLREHPKVADILEREGIFDTVSRAAAYLKGFAAGLESARGD